MDIMNIDISQIIPIVIIPIQPTGGITDGMVGIKITLIMVVVGIITVDSMVVGIIGGMGAGTATDKL